MRNWCFTINNYTEKDINDLNELKDMYILYSYETCPTTGTPHIQGYLYYQPKISMKALSKKIPRANLQIAKGDLNDNKTYIIGPYEKDGKIKPYNPNHKEIGISPKQGKRTDLDDIRDQIVNGETTTDDIAINNPMLYHQYARTLTKIEDIMMRKKYRTEMTKGIWYYGSAGTGKSHKAHENYHPDTHYTWKTDNGWQDGYTQQETVIINEFRGEIKYKDLLELVDKYPYSLNRRGKEPVPFTSKLVIITSSLPPSEIYTNLHQKDSLEQLTDRFQIIEIKGENFRKKNQGK